MKRALLVAVLLALAGLPALLWVGSSETTVEWAGQVRVIGMKTEVKVRAANPHGIRLCLSQIRSEPIGA